MRRFFLKLLRRRRLERELEAEIAFHREMAAQHGNAIPFGNALVVQGTGARPVALHTRREPLARPAVRRARAAPQSRAWS